MPQPLQDMHFLKSASDVRQLGACHGEVAFVGRSNVGKSSLLNALANRKQLARTSKTPGRTRLINVFLTGQDRWVVDLPGYGYAAGPKTETMGWRDMVEGYLLGRSTIRKVFILVDAEVGPTASDHDVIAWLQQVGLPYRVAAMKVDKVGPSRQLVQRRTLAADLDLQPDELAWVSARKGTGIPALRREIASLLDLPAT